MKLNFDLISFLIGTLIGSGGVWKWLQHRINRAELQLKKAKLSSELRGQFSDLMLELRNKQGLYADIRDWKKEVEGITHNFLNTLETEIDLVYDDILTKEKQLSIIEKRKPRKISKSHGGRPPRPSGGRVE